VAGGLRAEAAIVLQGRGGPGLKRVRSIIVRRGGSASAWNAIRLRDRPGPGGGKWGRTQEKGGTVTDPRVNAHKFGKTPPTKERTRAERAVVQRSPCYKQGVERGDGVVGGKTPTVFLGGGVNIQKGRPRLAPPRLGRPNEYPQ